jgi:hypothetical protein
MKATHKIHRLNEFFDVDEIDWFLAQARQAEIPILEAVDFLYDHTLCDYKQSEGLETGNVYNYLGSMLYRYGINNDGSRD